MTDEEGRCKTCEKLADRIADLERKLACARAEAIEDAVGAALAAPTRAQS